MDIPLIWSYAIYLLQLVARVVNWLTQKINAAYQYIYVYIHEYICSWLSLSRPRLSRITAYLEVKILSLSKHENLTTGEKYCGKEEKLLLRSNFSSFAQYFHYISNFKSPITYKFVECGFSNYFFLNSANPICRDMDILKYFRESLGIRDKESRLYIHIWPVVGTPAFPWSWNSDNPKLVDTKIIIAPYERQYPHIFSYFFMKTYIVGTNLVISSASKCFSRVLITYLFMEETTKQKTSVLSSWKKCLNWSKMWSNIAPDWRQYPQNILISPQKHILRRGLVNPSLAEDNMPCLSKQCRSRSAGFFRSQLIWNLHCLSFTIWK